MSKRKGFTLIEVALFLAVTAALFIGIAWGMQNSLFQQRYNDSVQSFLEFMRSIYSKVSNPQSTGAGNSDSAIYGKLVVFGETMDITGALVGDTQPIFTYDVIGKADDISTLGTGAVTTLLRNEEVNVIRYSLDSDGRIASKELSAPEKFEVRWQAAIENTDGEKYKGAVMVVRHPRSGVINTLVLDEAIQVNEIFYEGDASKIENLLLQYLNAAGGFKPSEVDFCVSPDGRGVVPRQNIRILSNARNASSVELIELDGSDNQCNR